MKAVCFECGSKEGVQRHHVVPRALGGKNTVGLCESCHKRLHGLGAPGALSHGELTRRGHDRHYIFEYLIITRLVLRGRSVTPAYLSKLLSRLLEKPYSQSAAKTRIERCTQLAKQDPAYFWYLLFEHDLSD